MQVIVEGEIFTGSPDALIGVMEARGYQAERENRNPHPYFQYAEGLKYKNGLVGKEKSKNIISRPKRREIVRTSRDNQTRI